MPDLPFKRIETGNGYAADLAASSAMFAYETKQEVTKLRTDISGVKSEVRKLTKVTLDLDEKDDVLQRRVYLLTLATMALAVAQVFVGIIQLFK